MKDKTRFIVPFVLSCILIIYFYTVLHEGGHALVEIMRGGKINEFVIGINAHISSSGASHTKLSEALSNSMGVLLPVIFLFIALIFYKPKIKFTFYHVFYAALSLSITSSLLAWVVIPFMSLFTTPPVGDDTTRFLDASGLHPLIVTLAASLLIVALAFFITKKGVIGKIKEINSELIPENGGKDSKAFLSRLMIGILVSVIILGVGFSQLDPKPVFETACTFEIGATTENMKLPFKVEKNKAYTMNLELKAEGFLTDVQIYTESGTLVYQNFGEAFTLGTSLNLEKGAYVFVLTFLRDLAEMQEHFESMGYVLEPEALETLEEIYYKNTLLDNYPVSFSVIIK